MASVHLMGLSFQCGHDSFSRESHAPTLNSINSDSQQICLSLRINAKIESVALKWSKIESVTLKLSLFCYSKYLSIHSACYLKMLRSYIHYEAQYSDVQMSAKERESSIINIIAG